MKKINLFLLLTFTFLLSLHICVYGSVYMYDKIPNSEFYAQETAYIEGVVVFNETLRPPLDLYIVELTMKNRSEEPINLNDAMYEAIREDGSICYMDFEEIDFDGPYNDKLILKPGNIATIYCRTPIANKDVNSINVRMQNGKDILFVPHTKPAEI
ncbi:MAG: hypothetical protein ABID09_07730 [Candidatus Omnitrophota bacterium]